MATARAGRTAAIGVAEHGNSAVLVTLAPGGELLPAMWDALLASVALRDRYLLPAVS